MCSLLSHDGGEILLAEIISNAGETPFSPMATESGAGVPASSWFDMETRSRPVPPRGCGRIVRDGSHGRG